MIDSLKISVLALFSLLVFSGCTKQTMLPAEIEKMTSRTYAHFSPEAIHEALSDLFFLADDRIYAQRQTSKHFRATRNHSLDIGVTFVEAKDTWTVETTSTPKGTQVQLDIRSDETWISGKTRRQVPEGPATYQQFWSRLDFLLGQSKTWMTCRDLHNEYLDDHTWGDTWWLCSEVKDRIPPELIKGIWETAKGLPLDRKDEQDCSQAVRENVYGTVLTSRQQEVYQALCLQEKGYDKVDDSDEIQP